MFEYTKVEEYGVNTLKDKVKKLNRRAKKIGVDELTINVSEPYFIVDPDYPEYNPIKTYIEVYDVEIVGELPQYEDWVFLATVEGYPNGQNILYKNPLFIEVHGDIDIDHYRNEKSYCDHCKTRRYRKNTYLIYHVKTKEIKQVGSTCIKDFLGHNIPTFGFYGKLLKELEEIDVHNGPRGKPYIELKPYLSLVAEIIDRNGFIGRTKANELDIDSTSDVVNYHYFSNKIQDKIDVSEDSIETAKKVIEWGKNLSERDNLNDYLYNLSVVFNNDIFEIKASGLVTSAVFAYKNEMGEIKDKKYENKISEYVGEVKDKIDITVEIIKELEIESKYGCSTMYLMRDDDSNIFVWYSSGKGLCVSEEAEWGKHTSVKKGKYYIDLYPDEGDKVRIKGTIKGHKEYKGKKQTLITRCKLIEIVKEKENV